MYRKLDSWLEYQDRQKADRLRACQPRWVRKKKLQSPLAPSLPDYALYRSGYAPVEPDVEPPRVGSTPTLQSEDIQRDFLKWNAILKDFDKLISVRPKTQYICSVDVKRTEVEPAMSHIRSSLPLSKGVPCSNLPALTTPNCVVKTPDIDAEAIQECDLLSDVNLRPWTRKKGPEADVLLGKRTCGRKHEKEARWFERMAVTHTRRILRAETMGFECLRA